MEEPKTQKIWAFFGISYRSKNMLGVRLQWRFDRLKSKAMQFQNRMDKFEPNSHSPFIINKSLRCYYWTNLEIRWGRCQMSFLRRKNASQSSYVTSDLFLARNRIAWRNRPSQHHV